jgi:hypothetical protein
VAKLGQIDLFTKRVRKPAAPLEFAFAVSVADLLRWEAAPGWQWSHYPAGENRDHKVNAKGQRWSPSGARLKRMGVQRGWPDFILIGPRGKGVHFLELKRRGKGRLSDEQEEFRDWCREHGYPWCCTTSFDEVRAQLKSWGALK